MFVSTTYGSAPTSGGKNESCVRVRACVRAYMRSFVVCPFIRSLVRSFVQTHSRPDIGCTCDVTSIVAKGGL